MARSSSVPAVLWLAIVSLLAGGLLHVTLGMARPAQLVAAAANLTLAYGLLRRAVWAYFGAVLAAVAAPLLLAFGHPGTSLLVLLLNGTVLVPVLLCTRSFLAQPAGRSYPSA